MTRFLAGSFDGSGRRIAVVVSRFNDLVTSRLEAGCMSALERNGVSPDDITRVEVPGARELPLACKTVADTGRFSAVVALGCVIRGETVHFELVANDASNGLGRLAVESGVPIAFGVLATDTLEQALQRAGGKMGNAGWTAALTALEMADLIERIAKA